MMVGDAFDKKTLLWLHGTVIIRKVCTLFYSIYINYSAINMIVYHYAIYV